MRGRFVVIGLDVPLAGACSLVLAAYLGRRFVSVGRCEWGVSRRMTTARVASYAENGRVQPEEWEQAGGVV